MKMGFWPVYWFTRFLLRISFRFLFGWKAIGQERMPATGPVIIACNHSSYLDPPILGAFFDRMIGFMARKSLFRNWFFGSYIRMLCAFPVDREGDARSAIRTFSDRLEMGGCVVIFPEGTRSETGKLGEIKPGIGMIATRTRAAILPVYIKGAFASWPKGQKGITPKPLRIETGELITVQCAPGDRVGEKAEQERINKEVARALHELEERAYAEV